MHTRTILVGSGFNNIETQSSWKLLLKDTSNGSKANMEIWPNFFKIQAKYPYWLESHGEVSNIHHAMINQKFYQ